MKRKFLSLGEEEQSNSSTTSRRATTRSRVPLYPYQTFQGLGNLPSQGFLPKTMMVMPSIIKSSSSSDSDILASSLSEFLIS